VRDAVFITVADLTNEYMATFGTREKYDWSALKPLREIRDFEGQSHPPRRVGSSLVVLDELGSRANVTDTHYECVQRVLDMREGQPLILISNKSIAEIGSLYDARIASRCEAGTVVKLEGRDRRLL
jgi:hypothetical protein